MKKTRKLIPAIVMLLVSAVMMSTASFAWFSMNSEVTATGMSISADSDSTALIISKTNSTVEDIRNENNGAGNDTVDLGITKSLKPSAYENITDKKDFVVGANKWYTGTSANAQTPTIVEDTKKTLTTENFAGHVVTGTVYLALAKGSASGAANVTAKVNISGTGVTPVKVVLVTDKTGTGSTEYQEFTTTNLSTASLLVDNQMTADEVVTVTYYIYYDGNDTNVFSNNIDNLGEATIKFTFSFANN